MLRAVTGGWHNLGTIYFVSHMDVFICFFRQALKSWKPRAFVSENEGDEFAFLIH